MSSDPTSSTGPVPANSAAPIQPTSYAPHESPLVTLSRQLSAKSENEKIAMLKDALVNFTSDDKSALVQALGARIPDPDQKTSDKVWLIIISAFAAVMLLSVLFLGFGMYLTPVTNGTKPDTVLTVFTTVTAFLAGLFTPSPTTNKS
ncbi:hypothetical protein GC170_09910 [bacterium]|nr:hypothetical protein [bacterium]